jgi:hypothetical protein
MKMAYQIFVTVVGILAAMCFIFRWWNVEITDFPTMGIAVLGMGWWILNTWNLE